MVVSPNREPQSWQFFMSGVKVLANSHHHYQVRYKHLCAQLTAISHVVKHRVELIFTFSARDNVTKRFSGSLESAGMVADSSSSKTLLVDAPVELTDLVTKHKSKIATCMHIDLVLACFPFAEWPRQSLPVHMNSLETFFRTYGSNREDCLRI